ncbi:hypothetical protein IJ596_04170 [bacterium]|nr:hypothetical protein [bacterium]
MSILGIAYREASRARKLVKIDATGNIAKYKKLGTTVDQFNKAVNVVKQSSGKYSRNPFKRIYRFFKEFFKNYKELRKSSKDTKLKQKQQKWNSFIDEMAAKQAKTPEATNNQPKIEDLTK